MYVCAVCSNARARVCVCVCANAERERKKERKREGRREEGRRGRYTSYYFLYWLY